MKLSALSLVLILATFNRHIITATSFGVISTHLYTLQRSAISPKDVAVMMCLLKVSRIKTSDRADSFIDLAGYAACAGEISGFMEDAFVPKSTDVFGLE